MSLISTETIVVGTAVLVLLPLVFVWDSRDTIRARHAVTLLILALVCGAVTAFAYSVTKGGAGSLAALLPAMVMLAAGGLGLLFLSAGVMAGLAVALRDDDAAEHRRQLKDSSGEPRRPSFAPQSAREVRTRLVMALSMMAALWSLALVHLLSNSVVPNYLRWIGLYRGPKDPFMLSFATHPGPYMLQILLAGLLALAFAAWAVVAYLRGK